MKISKWLHAPIRFEKQLSQFKKLSADARQDDFPITKRYPCLREASSAGGTAKGHYFHQDLLVAQKIFKNNPDKHVDIGSSVEGFAAHVASFREIEVFDIRPTESNAKNIIFRQADLMNMDSTLEDSLSSISSLHAIEHMGLGRYGDPLNPNGHLEALKNICRMLKKDGRFYFSVPIGPQRIEYNAHRVFSINYLVNLFKDDYTIASFSYVDDAGDVHADTNLTQENMGNNCGCHFGCGIFELIKK